MTARYTVTPCSCGRRMGVNGNDIHRDRASRSASDDLAGALGGALSSRDVRVPSEAPERLHRPVAALPPQPVMPLAGSRRRRVPPLGVVGG